MTRCYNKNHLFSTLYVNKKSTKPIMYNIIYDSLEYKEYEQKIDDDRYKKNCEYLNKEFVK